MRNDGWEPQKEEVLRALVKARVAIKPIFDSVWKEANERPHSRRFCFRMQRFEEASACINLSIDLAQANSFDKALLLTAEALVYVPPSYARLRSIIEKATQTLLPRC